MQKVSPLSIKSVANVLTQENGLPDVKRNGEACAFKNSRLNSVRAKSRLVSSGAVALKGNDPLPENSSRLQRNKSGPPQANSIDSWIPTALRKSKGIQIAQNHWWTRRTSEIGSIFWNMKNCGSGIAGTGNHSDHQWKRYGDQITELIVYLTMMNWLGTHWQADGRCRQRLILFDHVTESTPGILADPRSKLSKKAPRHAWISNYISASKILLWRGGMLTKYANGQSQLILDSGIHSTWEAGYILGGICPRATQVYPVSKLKKSTPSTKKWLASWPPPITKEVVVNDGAKASLTSASSFGAYFLFGNRHFGRRNSPKAIILLIKDEEGQKIGLGSSEYNSRLARSDWVQKKSKSPNSHDYLYLFDHDWSTNPFFEKSKKSERGKLAWNSWCQKSIKS